MINSYNQLKIENEQRKKAMDNQAKMIQDLKKERDELAEKIKVPICKEILKASIRKDNLIQHLRDEKKVKDEEIKRLKDIRDRLTNTVSELAFENNVHKKTIVQLREILERTEE